ncbi:MAG: TIGR03435 family protein [Terracidiphilus sp.]
MMRSVMGIAQFALLSATVFAQSAVIPPTPASNTTAADANPKFVIADVQVSPHRLFNRSGLSFVHGDRYILRRTTMRDLIAISYGLEAGFVKEGPSWLEFDTYDITAELPPGATADTEKLMLRALLEDRFKLVVHKGMSSIQAYTLMPGDGKVKMKPSDGTDDPGCKFQPSAPNQTPGPPLYVAFSCHNISMETFAKSLHGWTYDYSHGPILDSTGLKGTWDFDIKWTPRQLLASAGADGISIYDAVDKQLGLKLELQPASMPAVIVDSVNRTPTPNAPDLDKIMPPLPPPEFEVATIKPSRPDEQGNGRITADQVNLQATPLKFLIIFAWDLTPNDDEVIVGAPKWLDSDRFDIVAKVSSDAVGNTAQNPMPVDIEDLRHMLRTLLTDRFQMQTHMEDRPLDAYTMIAVNPKLRKADPNSRTRCGENPGPDGKDPRIANPALNRLISFQNMTMAQIGEEFQELAGGYIHSPVLDATGITGTWDFTLSFSSADLTRGGGGGVGAAPAPQGAPTASDPNGAVSFFDAINKQLGLKLEKQKRPLPVLVIDHIEEKPTEN